MRSSGSTTRPAGFGVARMHAVFRRDEVSQRLEKLPPTDHERLRSAVATLSVRDRKRVVAGLELLARAAQDAHARPSKRGVR